MRFTSSCPSTASDKHIPSLGSILPSQVVCGSLCSRRVVGLGVSKPTCPVPGGFSRMCLYVYVGSGVACGERLERAEPSSDIAGIPRDQAPSGQAGAGMSWHARARLWPSEDRGELQSSCCPALQPPTGLLLPEPPLPRSHNAPLVHSSAGCPPGSSSESRA